jgi:hypothetical protein
MAESVKIRASHVYKVVTGEEGQCFVVTPEAIDKIARSVFFGIPLEIVADDKQATTVELLPSGVQGVTNDG